MKSTIKRHLPLLLALALLAGCKRAAGNDHSTLAASAEKTSPTPAEGRKTGYFHVGDADMTFITWKKTDRQIKGQMFVIVSQPIEILDLNQSGKIAGRWFSFDGVFDGDDIRLSFRDEHPTLPEGKTVAGTFKGDFLTLFWPRSDGTLRTQEFRPMLEKMTKWVAARAEVERAETEKRAFNDARSELMETAKNLGVAVGDLPGANFYTDTLHAYGDAWREMREAYKDMLSEIREPLTDYQRGMARRKLETVKRHFASIVYHGSAFERRVSAANAKIRDAEEAVTRFQSAVAQARKAVGANTAGAPRPLVTAKAMATVIEDARSKIDEAAGARDAAKSQVAAYDRQAVDLRQQFDAIVKTRKPTDRD